MRQIKFRGKCQRGYDYSDGDGWIYGSLLQKDKVYAIVKTEDIDLSPNTDDGYSFVEDFGCIPVLPDTVSQFTGLTDRNGKEIYEGDVVQYEKVRIDWSKTIRTIAKFEIEYNDCANYNQDEASKLEIIGNIHDNPELINKKQ